MQNIDVELRAAHLTVARVMQQFGEKYLPLFSRLQKEIDLIATNERLVVEAQRLIGQK